MIGNIERGWGVGVASEGSSSAASPFPLTALFPRAILCDTGGRGEGKRGREGDRGKGQAQAGVSWVELQIATRSNQFGFSDY